MELHEPMVVYGKKTFTVQEYLEFERSSSEKHEFYKGEIFPLHGHGELLAMSGASRKRNTIFANLLGAMVPQLKGKSCQPFGPDMRVNIPENTLYTYPDISVFCGEVESSLQDEDTVIKPTVLIEILSPSTRNYDQGEKFRLYRDIPSLREYVIVDTEIVRIAVFRVNNTRHWELEEYTSLTDNLSLTSIQIIIPVVDIYQRTKLSKPAS